MATIDEIRAKYPQYADVPTWKLLKALHEKHYSDMDYRDFLSKIDVTPSRAQADIDAQAETALRDPGALKAAVISAAQGATFGASDEIAAGIAAGLSSDLDYTRALEIARGQLDTAREIRPGLSIASEVGGSLIAPVGALKMAGSLPVRMAKSAGMGGILSAIYGFNAGEGGLDERLESAKDSGRTGALIGGIIPALGAVYQKGAQTISDAAAVRRAAANAPTTEQLRAAGNAAYKAVDDAGVMIDPVAFRSAADDIVANMRAQGMDTGPMSLTPQSTRLAGVLDEAAGAQTPIPFRDVELLRRKAGIPAANMTTKAESNIGSGVIGALDDFVGNLTPAQVTAGNADDLPKLISDARSIWAKMSKSQLIDDAIEASDNYLSGAASGIRNQFKNILSNKKLSRGFSEAEKKLMRRVVNGSVPEQILQLFSGGIGQLVTIGAGGGLGGIPGAAIGAGVAMGARKGAEALSRRNAEVVRSVIANGGLPVLPLVSEAPRGLLEQVMRLGTAPLVQPQR